MTGPVPADVPFHCEVFFLTTVHTLASGSSGNAAVLSCGDTHLLLDAGISCRRITTALNALGLSPELLSAILITHTQSETSCCRYPSCCRFDE